jgi:hypothetical protein
MLRIRPAEHEERKLAYATWWQQMANLRPQLTPMGLWRRGCQKDVSRTLDHSNVLVAVHDDDPEDVLGLVCYGGTSTRVLLHFVYVKFHVRKWGIAKRLLQAAAKDADGVYFTTMPRPRFSQLILDPRWSFDPFAGTRLHYGTGPFKETKI